MCIQTVPPKWGGRMYKEHTVARHVWGLVELSNLWFQKRIKTHIKSRFALSSLFNKKFWRCSQNFELLLVTSTKRQRTGWTAEWSSKGATLYNGRFLSSVCKVRDVYSNGTQCLMRGSDVQRTHGNETCVWSHLLDEFIIPEEKSRHISNSFLHFLHFLKNFLDWFPDLATDIEFKS